MSIKLFLYVIILFFCCTIISQAQTDSINGHIINLSVGLKLNSSNSTLIPDASVGTETGFTGFIGHEYQFNTHWSFTSILGLFGVESFSDFNGVSDIKMSYFMIGFRYYPDFFSIGNTGRSYVGANIGSYMGSAYWASTEPYFLDPGDINENQWGGQMMIGIA